MKVLHVLNSHSYSGAENVVCTIIENMPKAYECVYMSPSGSIEKKLEQLGIAYYGVDQLNPSTIKTVIRELQPDMIHAHDYKASCICAMSGVNIPLISHLHNNSPWLKTLHPYSFLYLLCSRHFQTILTVSDSIKNEYIFSKHIVNKIECIGNPISRKKILAQVEQSDYETKYDICCVARLTKQKNPFKFIDIICEIKKEIPNINAIWIGAGELEQDCKERVSEKHLDDNICFGGFQQNPYKYMAASRIFLLTSDWEGFGLVALEAMNLGKPVVASPVGGLCQLVNDQCGKLCSAQEDFVREIMQLMSDATVYREKSVGAEEQAKRYDNVDQYIKRMVQIYSSLLSG